MLLRPQLNPLSIRKLDCDNRVLGDSLKIAFLVRLQVLGCLLDPVQELLEAVFSIWKLQFAVLERRVEANGQEFGGVGEAVDLEAKVLHVGVERGGQEGGRVGGGGGAVG